MFNNIQPNNQVPDKKLNQGKSKILYSIWFWWIFTTVLYLFVIFLGNLANNIGFFSFWDHTVGFIGLFVPYGMISAILFLSSLLSWLSLILFLIAMILVEKFLNKKNYNLKKRILINLLVLLILTFIVDAIRGTYLESWKIFLEGTRILNISL